MNISLPSRKVRTLPSFAQSLVTFDANQTEDDTTFELEIPEDLSTLSDTNLAELHVRAVEAFNALYGDGKEVPAEILETLSALTEAIEVLSSEKDARATLATEQREKAAAMAAKVNGGAAPETSPADDATETLAAADPEAPHKFVDAEGDGKCDVCGGKDGVGVHASADAKAAVEGDQLSVKRSIRLPKSSATAQRAAAQSQQLAAEKSIRDIFRVMGADLGVQAGTGVNFSELGEALNTRLRSFNQSQYQAAANQNRALRDVGTLATLSRDFAPELTITNNDREHIEGVIREASKLTRMKQATLDGRGSLVASGGWAGISETLYNQFLQLEASTGELSVPEVVLARGGAQVSEAVSFAEIFAAVGFDYTEADDIAGEYAADGTVGPKPSYHIGTPEFTEYRLDVYGLIIEAGLLAARGYPEFLADIIRKALVAHFHKLNAAKIAEIAAGSTAITMPAGQVGATASLLRAVELQAEHLRDSHRMDVNAKLELAIPNWSKGAMRSDLSQRLGVDLIGVNDARLVAWLTDRNVNVQFVQDYQSISTTAATAFTQWPSTVQFLLYPAGTWVAAKSDIITIDTLYDSVNLKNNDFTALFTEEGQKMLKVGPDSRKVTVAVDATGYTNAGGGIDADGTAAAAV
jgi:hypothetical protein